MFSSIKRFFDANVTAQDCAYCGSPIQREGVHDAEDRIPADGVLPFSVETDKAIVEVPAPHAGRIARCLGEPGDVVAVLGCGEPVAATFIFSFTEVFAGFENMVGGVADTLLALVWTQYQYFLFPLIFGYFGVKLLLDDWRQAHS